MAKKEIATKGKQELDFSDAAPDYIKDGERGQENVGMEDITIPRLDVLQDLSPQRKKNDPAYIEGAEEGMLFNTVTGELYGDQVYFVPCYYKKEWLIWKKQTAGGGFNGAFPTEAAAVAEFSEQGYDNDEYEIVDTANHFGLIFKDVNNVSEIVISMAKSKMKVNRQLNTLVKMNGGDRFSRVYKVSAIEDSNAANQTFFNLKVTALGYVPKELYEMGEKMYESIAANEKKADYSTPSEVKSNEPEEY